MVGRTGWAIVGAIIGTLGLSGLTVQAQARSSSSIGVSLVYPQPAAGFDPLTATDAQLAYYGLPPRPPASNHSALASWTTAMEHAKYEVASPDIMGPTSFSSFTGDNWSGYYNPADQNGGEPYNEVSANWTVPSVPSSGSGNQLDAWVGMGGVANTGGYQPQYDGYIEQAGTISTASDPATYRFVWEYYTGSSSPLHYQGPAVTAGDSVYVDITTNTSTLETTFFMENLTTNQYFSTPPESTPGWSGNTADFEFEMPAGDTALPKFPTTPFTGCFEWQGNTLNTVVSATTSIKTTISPPGGAYAYPTALGTANDGFNEVFGSS